MLNFDVNDVGVRKMIKLYSTALTAQKRVKHPVLSN